MRLRPTEKFLWDIFELMKFKDELMNDIWSKKWYGIKDPFETLWPDLYGMRDRYWEKYRDKKKRERWVRMVRYLKNKGYLNIKDLKNRKAIMLTPRGMEKVFGLRIQSTQRKRRADKKWQMIFFDIPEERRKDRDRLRKYLRYLGYKQLQKSIWVCPYNALKETQQIIKNYKLSRFARLLLVEEVKI